MLTVKMVTLDPQLGFLKLDSKFLPSMTCVRTLILSKPWQQLQKSLSGPFVSIVHHQADTTDVQTGENCEIQLYVRMPYCVKLTVV